MELIVALKILIIGVNGFIGHHLATHILNTTDWEIFGIDIESSRLINIIGNERFNFLDGDILINKEWIEDQIKICDLILPLVAITNPSRYIKESLKVFELTFEENLSIVRLCAKYKKRVIFPSTSEVYGMCEDSEFDPYTSNLILGPIAKTRWIYACSKQLMERVIIAYGQQQCLNYTLFRPFNFIGSGLDSIHDTENGRPRVLTQFLGNIIRGNTIKLVNGGQQRRSFTDINDGVSALMSIIENKNDITNGKIYNIGNPLNNISIRDLAELMLEIAKEFPEYKEKASLVKIVDISSEVYYGEGYQDVAYRVPAIKNTREELNWEPKIDIHTSIYRVFEECRNRIYQV